MRQVVLDTETTGLETEEGHRVLEIGCVEMVGRKITGRHFHHYINPERDIDDGALEVHGISRSFLEDKPLFSDIWSDFLEFIRGTELIIHNAAFDLTFLNNEIALMVERSASGPLPEQGQIGDYCTVVDTLLLARQKHPGQKNNLDALCKRYLVDNSQRDLHGALLDAEILADVYLALTGGQVDLGLEVPGAGNTQTRKQKPSLDPDRKPLRVIRATGAELEQHQQKLQEIDSRSEAGAIWYHIDKQSVDS